MSELIGRSLWRVARAFGKVARDGGASRERANKLQRAYWRLFCDLEPNFDAGQQAQLKALIAVARAHAPAGDISLAALSLFAPAGLRAWAVIQRPQLNFSLQDAKHWLEIARAPPRGAYIERVVLNVASRLASKAQLKKFEALFDQLWHKERAMAVTYIFDPRGLPSGFDAGAQDKFVEKVFERLDTSFYPGGAGAAKADKDVSAVIIGSLILKEIFDPLSSTFGPAIDEAALFSLKDTPSKPPGGKKNRDLYVKVASTIALLPGRSDANGDTTITYQEIAYVSKFATDNASIVNFDSDYFPNQVRIGVDRYVEGTPPELTLSIPPLNGAAGTDSGFNPDGARAVGTVSQAYQLDIKANVIRTVDRITELYMQGLLPMNYDAAAKAIEDYYWDSEDRLHEGARNSVYGRVLGIPNAEVSKEVVPNRDRDGLLQRFVAALAEHDRQQTISDLLQPGAARAASLTVEQVRKAGRDVLANASLYGWGGTQSLARRLVKHLSTAMNILKQPSLQAVFGVTSPYQVIERVSRTEFGSVPNLLMAINVGEAEKGIHELLAKYLTVFLEVNSGRPLFDIQGGGLQGVVAIPGSIPSADERLFKTFAQSWLAARSYGDAQVEKFSQPQDSPYTGSMPTFGGAGGGAGGGDVMDKLRQMVSSGSAPSLDQLQQLLPAMR